jgi:hypothetical protein
MFSFAWPGALPFIEIELTLAFCRRNWHQARDGHARLGNRDFLSQCDTLEKLGEMRLGFVNVNLHPREYGLSRRTKSSNPEPTLLISVAQG